MNAAIYYIQISTMIKTISIKTVLPYVFTGSLFIDFQVYKMVSRHGCDPCMSSDRARQNVRSTCPTTWKPNVWPICPQLLIITISAYVDSHRLVTVMLRERKTIGPMLNHVYSAYFYYSTYHLKNEEIRTTRSSLMMKMWIRKLL